MNQKIIDLANKANKDIGYTFKLEDAKQLHELIENFAKLIAEECAREVALKYPYGVGICSQSVRNWVTS